MTTYCNKISHLQTSLKFTIIFVILVGVTGLTSTTSFSPSTQYVKTGSYQINTYSFYQQSSVVGTQIHYFDIPLTISFSSYKVVLSFRELKLDIPSNRQMNLTIIPVNNGATVLRVALISKTANLFQDLRIFYLLLYSALPNIDVDIFSFHSTTNNGYKLSQSKPINQNYAITSINTTGTVRCFAAIAGFNLTLTSTSKVINFNITGTQDSSNSNLINILIKSTTTTAMNIESMIFSIVYWNENKIETGSIPIRIIHDSLYRFFEPSSSGGGNYQYESNSNSNYKSYNTFYGVSALIMQGFNRVDWDLELDSNRVEGQADQVDLIDINLICFLFKACPIITPYYRLSDNLCYDQCPNGYYGYSLTNSCQICSYDCDQCNSNQQCTSCDSSNHHRTLSNNRCIPITGYFDDGSNTPTSLPCDSGCQNCYLISTNCTSCSSGLTLLGSVCIVVCPYDCLTCDSVTLQCTSCEPPSDNRELVAGRCVPESGYFDNGSNSSSTVPCDSGCQNCQSVSSNCTSCHSGFSLSGSVCVNSSSLCPYDCLTCDSVTLQCTSCEPSDNRELVAGRCVPESGYFDNGSNSSSTVPCDSGCQNCQSVSSNCTSCHSGFSLSGSVCVNSSSLCPYDCLTCDSVTLQCTSCEPSDNRELVAGRCVPESGYFDNGSNSSSTVPCDSGCQNCQSVSSNCTSCHSGFSLSGSVCVNSSSLCPYDCLTCDSVTLQCTSCEPSDNRELVAGRCVPESGYFDNGSNSSSTVPCDSGCQNCQSVSSNCTSCHSGFSLSGSVCVNSSSLCPYDCLTCDSVTLQCTSCEPSDNRELVAGRCVPESGYFDNGSNSSSTVPCDSGCQNCQSVSSNCTSCHSGFSLSGSVCVNSSSLCPYDCLTCDSVTLQCTSCEPSDNRELVAGRCVPESGYFDNGSNSSSTVPCDSGCQNCQSVSSNCTSCHSGFSLSGSVCVNSSSLCPYDCLTCDSVTLQCTSCEPSDNRELVAGRCVPESGYFDNGSNSSSTVPCDSGCQNCQSVSSNCTSCHSGFSLSGSVCVNSSSLCPYDCLTCDSVTLQCTSCEPSDNRELVAGRCVPESGYFDNGSNSSSTVPCDSGCQNCQSVSSNCTSCHSGFSLSGSVCVNSSSLCPYDCLTCDSVTLQCTSCEPSDNRELVAGRCVPESGYFDNGSNSSSTVPCDSGCQNCQSVSSNCTSCPSNSHLSDHSCICDLGYTLQDQQCVSPNISSGNCSSACLLSDGNFCSANNECTTCLDNCLNCTSSTSCFSCHPLSNWNGLACVPDCTQISNCLTCSISSSLICLSCDSGYRVSNTICIPLCGDGVILSGQICDDGNLNNGDGCNQICQVEDHFICNGTTSTGASECYLLSLGLNHDSTFKDATKNSFTMIFDPQPSSLSSLYQTIDWNKIFTVSPQSTLKQVIISTVIFNPNTGKIELIIDYSQDATNKDIKLDTNYDSLKTAPTTNSSNSTTNGVFNILRSSAVQTTLRASNNLSLDYYQDSSYSMASLVHTIALALSVAALLVSLVALLGAKLIGLEMIAVFQVSFLSMLSLNDMGPIMNSLQGLQYCVGYNKLGSYDTLQNLDPEFIAIEFNQSFIKNYNFTALMIIIPIILAIVFKILSKIFASSNSPSKAQRMQGYFQLAIGQYTFYGFMFSGYLVFVSFTISILLMQSTLDVMGLAVGGTFLLAGLLFQIFLCKVPQFFGEFKLSFHKTTPNYYFYNILIFERIFAGAILGFITWFSYQSAAIAVIYLIQLIYIVIKRPYLRQNWRPISNMLILLIIEVIYYLMNNFNNNLISNYGPLIVLSLLAVCFIYSTVLIVIELKNKIAKICSNEESQYQDQQQAYFKPMDNPMLSSFRHNLLSGSPTGLKNQLQIDIQLGEQVGAELTPRANQLSTIRNMLNKVKCSGVQTMNATNIVNTLNFEDNDIFKDLQDDNLEGSDDSNLNLINKGEKQIGSGSIQLEVHSLEDNERSVSRQSL